MTKYKCKHCGTPVSLVTRRYHPDWTDEDFTVFRGDYIHAIKATNSNAYYWSCSFYKRGIANFAEPDYAAAATTSSKNKSKSKEEKRKGEQSMIYFYDRYWGIFSDFDPRDSKYQFKDDVIGYGYSGNAHVLNDVHEEVMHNVGPLPEGTYAITSVYDDPHRGPHTCVLSPNPPNQMYGRSGFLIHGDTAARKHDASDGCIIAPPWVRLIFQEKDTLVVI